MMGNGFNSGFLVSFASGVNRWMKQQSNTHTGALLAIQTDCLGALHGEQSLTVLNRCGMLVFNKNIIWNF